MLQIQSFLKYNTHEKIMKKLFIIFTTIFLFSSMLTRANLISVISSHDGTGMFTYSVSSSSSPFYFGGDSNMLKVVIPSAGVMETYSPDGWYSTVDASNIVTWLCTNSSSRYIDESPLEFKIESIYKHSTNYSGHAGTLWQKGYVAGEVYDTNYFLYSSVTTNGVASINVVGYEKFEFTGPMIPEPALLIIYYLAFVIYYRRKFIPSAQAPRG